MEKLLDILKNIKPEVDFKTNSKLIDDGLMDSLDIFAVILEIEKQFSIEVNPNQIDPENFQSIESIWTMIQEIQNKNTDYQENL